MFKEKQKILIGLLLLPLLTFAHGEEVLLSVLPQVVVCVFIFIALWITKWKPVGKVILLLSYILPVVITQLVANEFSYRGNEFVITSCLIVFPCFGLMICYLMLKNRFELSAEHNKNN